MLQSATAEQIIHKALLYHSSRKENRDIMCYAIKLVKSLIHIAMAH